MRPIPKVDTEYERRVEKVSVSFELVFGGRTGLRDRGLLESAYAFLGRGLEMQTCDFAHLLPWIRRHLRERDPS